MRFLIVAVVLAVSMLGGGIAGEATGASNSGKSITEMVQENNWTEDVINQTDSWVLAAAGMMISEKKEIKNFSQVSKRLLDSAFDKNKSVAWMIGRLFENNLKEIKKAIDWYNKAASNGDWLAHRSLGHLYYFGTDVKEDYKLARYHLQKADDELSAARLGDLYLEGLGVQKDPKQALFWYLRSVSKGNAKIMVWIGNSYWIGEFESEDNLITGFAWTIAGAYFDDRDALENVALRYPDLTTTEIKSAKEMADKLVAKYKPAIQKRRSANQRRKN
jgi:TPR repeat protein